MSFSASSAAVDGEALSITLSGAADADSTIDKSDFAVQSGDTALTISSASVSGSAITLTLSQAAQDPDCFPATITVSYTRSASSIADSAATQLSDFSSLSVSNNTDDPPAITSVETDADGQYIYVTFCEEIYDLSYNWSDFSAFTVLADGVAVTVSDLARDSAPKQLDISLNSTNPITEGQSVTLAYDQSKGNDDHPLRDKDQGQTLVPSWSARAVTNIVDNAPTLQSVSAEYDVVTLTFSEALNESNVPAASAFSVSGLVEPVTPTLVEVDGSTAVLTFDAILTNVGSPTYQLDYSAPADSPLQQADGQLDVADISSFDFVSSTPTAKPTVTAAEVDGATMEITFDLPIGGVSNASTFTIGGQTGVTVSAAAFEGKVVTLTLSPAVSAGSTITVSYAKPNAPPRLQGRNRKDVDSFTNQAVTNNTTAPIPEFSSAVVSADGASLTLTFSLALLDSGQGVPDASTFSISGSTASVDSLTISGATVSLTLSPTADVDQTITIAYTPPTDQTAARLQSVADSQAVAAFSGESVTNNADGKPRPTVAEVSGDSLTISFDRPLDANSTPAATNFTVGGTSATVTNVSFNGSELTLTLSPPLNHLAMITVSYTVPTVPMASPLKRDGKEIQVDSFMTLAVSNLTPDPTPTFDSASVDATGRTLTVVMSHPLLSTAAGTPTTTAFTLGGTTQAAIDSLSIDGSSVVLGLSPAADLNETITVSYVQPTDSGAGALQSVEGGWKTAAWTNESVTNNTDGVPRLLSATANADSMVLVFDRALDEDAKPPKSDFTIVPADISVSSLAIDGDTVTLTLLEAVEFGETVTVSYSAADSVKLKRDGLAPTVAAFPAFTAKNETPEPLVRSVIGDGTSIVVTFSVMLDTDSRPDATTFSLGSDGHSISNVTISAMTVTLTLSASLTEGEEYTLTYTAPMTSALQKSDGTAIPDLSEAVTNNTDVAPTPVSAVGDESTLTIEFDQALDSTASIVASSFAVSGELRTVSNVTISEANLVLTLSNALKEDETATVAYTKPGQGGIVDPTGNQTESFTLDINNQTDTAPKPVSGTVNEKEIVIILDQAIYEDMRFDPVDSTSVLLEHFTFVGTDAVVAGMEISNDGPGGVGKIVITLSEAVEEEDSITIRYFPASGNIRIVDDDAAANRVQINNYALDNLTDVPPVVDSATVDSRLLTILFDQELDDTARPSNLSFSLSNDGPAIESISISGKTLRLTLAASVAEDETYELTYTKPDSSALVDGTGSEVVSFTRTLDENTTDYAPFPIGEPTATDEYQFILTFDQPLAAPSATIDSRFSLEPGRRIKSVTWDQTDGKSLTITLEEGTPIRESSLLSLKYTKPGSGGLQDDDGDGIVGNHVESFTRSVINNVDVAPQVEGIAVNRRSLRIEFDQALDPDHVPPPNCEWLESEGLVDAGICDLQPNLWWFRITDENNNDKTIESVRIDGVFVQLLLVDSVRSTEAIEVNYASQSAGDGRWNLRDTSTDPNQVGPIDQLEATNFTAASAMDATFDRSQPTIISISFDGPLQESSNLDSDPLTVSVDGAAVAIQSVSASGTELTITLAQAVPECSSLALVYSPNGSAWLDSNEREIEAFSFEVGNFIDPTRGLTCITSDSGALAMSFSADARGGDVEIEWSLSVNGEPREFNIEQSDGVVRLVPSTAVCVGDVVKIAQTRSDQAEDLTLSRVIEVAAPCVVSAVAVGTELRITFDQPLDGDLINLGLQPSDFTVGGGAQVVEIVSIEGPVLTLRLAPPGVSAGDDVSLGYSGSSLSGGGLTIGPFAIPVSDQTEPPEFLSGFAAGALIVLEFDQPLLVRNVPTARFLLAGTGVDLKVSEVETSGSNVYLHLASSLPDEPDLFAVVYLQKASGGLAGLTGARVADGVFPVTNYTETAPNVVAVEVDGQTLEVTFDQRIDGADANPDDFVVFAGRRRVELSEMEWTRRGVVLTIAERVTSPDAVLLTYTPSEDGVVRDLSGLELAEFAIWAENHTDRAETMAELIADARLRSSSGGTTFERELIRGVAATGGMQVTIEPGAAWTSVAYGTRLLSINAGGLDNGPLTVRWSRLDDASDVLERLDSVPASCWNEDDADRVHAWWLGESDTNGVPTDHGVQVSLLGSIGSGLDTVDCVLDLISGQWSYRRPGVALTSPSLIVSRDATPRFSSNPWLLAG